MDEEFTKEEFRPRNSQYMQIQAGAFVGLIFFTFVLRLAGVDEAGRFIRHLLTIMPILVLMPVLFNLTSWPVHTSNRIVIDEYTISGPVQTSRRLESRTLALADIDRQRTEDASFYAMLLGPMKIYATNGETIALDVIGLGRPQIRRIYERIGCEAPVFPMENALGKMREAIAERKNDLRNMLLVAIIGAWLFMIFVEELDVVQSPLLAYFIGMASGVGIFYCFTQLTSSE